MRFAGTAISGVVVIDLDLHEDERGFFARTYSRDELRAGGLEFTVAQAAISHNRRRGTVRGLHFQDVPHAEAKMVSCLQGSLVDLAVDLRPSSSTFLRHVAVELSAANRRMLHLPPGVAHGFQTLEDHVLVGYLLSQEYVPDLARGYRWDDPAFAISLPLAVEVISDRDRSWPPFAGAGRTAP